MCHKLLLAVLSLLTLVTNASFDSVSSSSFIEKNNLQKNRTQIVYSSDDLAKEIVEEKIDLNQSFLENHINSIQNSTSLETADYILDDISDPNDQDSFNPTNTPITAFKRRLDTSGILLSSIETGDIIIETDTVLGTIGHSAIVYNYNKHINMNPDNQENDNEDEPQRIQVPGPYTYIQTIEAVSPKVSFGFLDGKRVKDYGVVILRVTHDSYTKTRLCSFALAQVGKPYNFPFTDSPRAFTDINSPYWYCSELVNACYYYANINLNAVSTYGTVLPFDLVNSLWTYFAPLDEYIDCKLVSKTNNKYKLRLYNDRNSSITVYYNKKMCFYNDAKTWQHLNDVDSITVGPHDHEDIYVSTNLFADAIALSTTSINRYVTILKNLDATACRMKVHRNKI